VYFSLNRFILQVRRVIFNVSLPAHVHPPLPGNMLIGDFACRGHGIWFAASAAFTPAAIASLLPFKKHV
jgi:hypothetical protein